MTISSESKPHNNCVKKCYCKSCKYERLKESVEIQNKLDDIPLYRKFLDPITFITWGFGVIMPMTIFGIWIGGELCK